MSALAGMPRCPLCRRVMTETEARADALCSTGEVAVGLGSEAAHLRCMAVAMTDIARQVEALEAA
jgi:hypothetical protein